MKIHHLTSAEALENLGSSMAGLSDEMIDGRLHEFGFNRIEETKKNRRYWRLRKRFCTFLH